MTMNLAETADRCINHPTEPASWMELYCQECWEAYTNSAWWELIRQLAPNR